MAQTIAQTLADIRTRSIETWRIAALPPVDPVTGIPKPLRIISQADEDVKFLLERLNESEEDIRRLEDLLARYEDEELDDERIEGDESGSFE
jgi:hypothetical protein